MSFKPTVRVGTPLACLFFYKIAQNFDIYGLAAGTELSQQCLYSSEPSVSTKGLESHWSFL